ncbi:MAG: sugar ABC transporter ATP-binding protein [Eubacteriales bacterium]|nr:sugar ABC transporter ATP-binding protein [Eubacteriales bacterium]
MTILEMEHVSKAFGGSLALNDVHLTVEKGEIHALLGENGAGKSTLMNILTGVVSMDSGSIQFDGAHFHNPTIKQMEAAGIAFVHQEINVVNDLTVFENIFLNREIQTPFKLLDRKKMIASTRQLFQELGVNIDPLMSVSDLKTSQKQLLVICRALHADAKLLILDEPTTALSNEEIAHLFSILKKSQEKDKSFIFISHKMPEIFELADRYTVLRNGEFVSTGLITDTTPNQIASDMVGKQFTEGDVYRSRTLGETYVELDNLSGPGFNNISLKINRGEVVAFTGLAGCGASELLQSMFGAQPIETGSLKINNQLIKGKIDTFMRHGVAMLPSNRKENSVIHDLNILDNMVIAEHVLSRRKMIINQRQEAERYTNQKNALNIKSQNPNDAITSLSGGNQQKVFLARWLNTDAHLLLFDNPTQGVDVAAKEEIYKLILKFASEGKTVIINTLEIPEIKKVSDRCVVFFEGQIVRIFDHTEISEHDVMLYSTNAVNTRGGHDHVS